MSINGFFSKVRNSSLVIFAFFSFAGIPAIIEFGEISEKFLFTRVFDAIMHRFGMYEFLRIVVLWQHQTSSPM
jgi:hypothetical protein